MSAQANRLRGKRKRKRAKAMERCILRVKELNEREVSKLEHDRAASNLFRCVTSKPIFCSPSVRSVTIDELNRWTDEKLKYYNLPYVITTTGNFDNMALSIQITFIGAMHRHDDLVHVLHI